MEIGASFCHVRRSIPAISEMPCVTSGTQKWNGVIPIFIASAIVIVREVNWLWVLVIFHCPEFVALSTIVNMSSMEAVACVRKYFVAASVDRGL